MSPQPPSTKGGLSEAKAIEKTGHGLAYWFDVLEVSVSKVMTAKTADVIKALTDARMRKRWIDNADAKLAKALTAGVAAKSSKGFVVRPDGLGRFRYKWDGTIVQFYLIPKPGNKVSLAVQHTKLPGAESVEQYRAQWKAAFGAIAKILAT